MILGPAIAWLPAFTLCCLNAVAFPQELTSLYIPGFEWPQPIEADVVGVGEDGRTTWELQQGDFTSLNSGSFEVLDFPGTATLVQGSDYASLTYSATSFTIGQVCALNEGLAVCTIVVGGNTMVQTEVVTSYPVQQGTATLVGSVSVTPTPTQSTSGSGTSPTPPFLSGFTPTRTSTSRTSTPTETDINPSSDASEASAVEEISAASTLIRGFFPFWPTAFCSAMLLSYFL